MYLSSEGDMGNFCCADFENYSLKPTKAIGFDLMWKRFDNDKPEPKAFIYFQEGSGVATQQYGTPQPAGYPYAVIKYCPFCSQEIDFS